jgi:ABC-type phosphate/phosphonate transport system permease subunit
VSLARAAFLLRRSLLPLNLAVVPFGFRLDALRIARTLGMLPLGSAAFSLPPLEGFLARIVRTLGMLVGHVGNYNPGSRSGLGVEPQDVVLG